MEELTVEETTLDEPVSETIVRALANRTRITQALALMHAHR
jgi:hypothetical protein